MADMFIKEIKSFMGDIPQSNWDLAFGKKEEIGTAAEENEKFKKEWNDTINVPEEVPYNPNAIRRVKKND